MITTISRLCCQLLLLFLAFPVMGQVLYDTSIRPADERPSTYLPLLKGKRVALIINQTATVQGVLLADYLLSKGVAVKKVFVPEHGFRGTEDAGAHIGNGTDSATGLPVISLYGKKKGPAPNDLADVDVLVYDLQDVGVRFYTYISTMQYCMEAVAAAKKQFIVLDRPNPNGFYVDGPVLEREQRSFVGMQPVPIVYGMTAGEYARMITGEKWFVGADKLRLKVVPCTNYTHSKHYKLPVAPSPNLRNMSAVYGYPSLCFFEGTPVSVGRGTDLPFQQYGCPEFEGKLPHHFTPKSGPGSKSPPYENKKCFGEVVAANDAEILSAINGRLRLHWLLRAYLHYPNKEDFFTSFFTKLSGTPTLASQIKEGKSEQEIHDSWGKGLNDFRKIRKKYLLYPDFE